MFGEAACCPMNCVLTDRVLDFKNVLEELMKRSVSIWLIAVVMFGLGQVNAQAYENSPAQALFDQATYYLSFNYHGFSSTDPNSAAFVEKYQKQLDLSCFVQRQNCAYDISVPLIKAMVEEIGDGHTNYLAPDAAQDFVSSSSGKNTDEIVTMGFIPLPFIDEKGFGLRVYDVLEGSGAASAGLTRGDRIVAINQQALPRDQVAVRKLLLAADGSGQDVRLSILRDERFPLELTVPSRKLTLNGLPFMSIAGGVARIVIPEFFGPAKTAPKVHELVKRAIDRKVAAIVVDLRDDPGGISTECLAGVGAFVGNHGRLRESRFSRSQDIFRDGGVYQVDDKGKATLVYKLENSQLWTGKVAVLVNQNSASCSEYFAADVQYAKRGVVIGERTVGVGNTGTLPFNLINGGALQITVVKSFHLDGTVYQAQVTPDVFVKDDLEGFVFTGRDHMMDRALQELGVRSSAKTTLPLEHAKRFWFNRPARTVTSGVNTLLEMENISNWSIK
jgi:carboxyl-terminal processing protease